MVALTRLVCPDANIPSTTALATINKADGRELGLQRGANIVMPNLTPPEYRAKYEIYPDKACRERDGRGLPRLPAGPHRVARPHRRRGPGGRHDRATAEPQAAGAATRRPAEAPPDRSVRLAAPRG